MVDIGGEILCFPLLDDVNVLFVTLSEIFFLGGFSRYVYLYGLPVSSTGKATSYGVTLSICY